jgi:hypothetical protein
LACDTYQMAPGITLMKRIAMETRPKKRSSLLSLVDQPTVTSRSEMVSAMGNKTVAQRQTITNTRLCEISSNASSLRSVTVTEFGVLL